MSWICRHSVPGSGLADDLLSTCIGVHLQLADGSREHTSSRGKRLAPEVVVDHAVAHMILFEGYELVAKFEVGRRGQAKSVRCGVTKIPGHQEWNEGESSK